MDRHSKSCQGNEWLHWSFPYLPLNEQKRIVAKIEELQARSKRAREALENIPDLLEQLRQVNPGCSLQGRSDKDMAKKTCRKFGTRIRTFQTHPR